MAFTPASTPAPSVGDKAPGFTLKGVDGKMTSLKDFASSKGVVVIFSCNHCPWVKKYEDRMVSLDKTLKAKGFPVVAINSNDASAYAEDSYEKMVERAKQKGFTFPYLVDETQEVGKAYGASRTPQVYLLQRSGADFFIRYIGAIDDNADEPQSVSQRYVENAVDALLAGKAVPVATTKAVGCTIKWKE